MERVKLIRERIDLSVTAANQTFKGNILIDKHASVIIGFQLISNFDDKLYNRGSLRIIANGEEIYENGHESKLLMTGLNVPVDQRIIRENGDILPGNRKVEIEYTDADHPYAFFNPYKVTLYIISRSDNQA